HICGSRRIYTCPLCGTEFHSYATFYGHASRVVERLLETGVVERTGARLKGGVNEIRVYRVNGELAAGAPEALRLLAKSADHIPDCRALLSLPPPVTLEKLEEALRAYLDGRRGTEVWVPFARITSAAGAGRMNGTKAREAAELLLLRAPPGWRGVRIEQRKRRGPIYLVFRRKR
ncbi:MAG: hypothetical protein QXT28_11970, partial [Thermofilaceae archaeon]